MKHVLTAILFAAAAPAGLAQTCLDPSDLAGQNGARDFTQTRELTGVPAPLRSSGHVAFSDEEIVWTVTSPLTIVTRVAPDGMTQSIEGGDPEPVGAGGADNPLLNDSGLLDLLRGDLSRLDERYDVVREADDAGWTLKLTPKLADMAEFVSGVTIKGCMAVDAIRVDQSNGDAIAVAFDDQS